MEKGKMKFENKLLELGQRYKYLLFNIRRKPNKN